LHRGRFSRGLQGDLGRGGEGGDSEKEELFHGVTETPETL